MVKVATTHRRPANHERKYLLNGTFGLHARAEAGLPPNADQNDTINNDRVNRTRVRAKMRVMEIRHHSRQEMKKAS